MEHHEVFKKFTPQESRGTGRHVFDFLGVATEVKYKKGWDKHALKEGQPYKPGYPSVNEHYFDWIALLTTVSEARGVFRMAEFGAGWAPWLVRGALAARQMAGIEKVELLGIEADTTHFRWMMDHFQDNSVSLDCARLIYGAVSSQRGMLRFPRIDNPDENYGASVGTDSQDYVEVSAYTVDDMFEFFSGPLDFLHVDIQGAEYDVIPASMDVLKKRVRNIMIGTHKANEKHDGLLAFMLANGWVQNMAYRRRTEEATPFGPVKFDDGFLFFRNAAALG